MRIIHEALQLVLETMGLLLLAAGLGVAAYQLVGWSGFLIISGVTLSAAAWRAEVALHPRKPKPAPLEPRIIERTWWRLAWLTKDTEDQ